jgi:hypothetical protein
MKSSIMRLVIASSLGLLVALSCTLPFYIGTPEPEIVYVEVTSTPSATEQPTEGPAQTGPTPTVSVNLDGEWFIWYGSSEKQLKISFLQKDYSLVGNAATDDGNSLLFNGTISQEGVSVTGTWESTNGTSGSFIMQLGSSLTTFSGNLGGGVPFCGSRSGAKPSPCLN